jgi:hypothetical protein
MQRGVARNSITAKDILAEVRRDVSQFPHPNAGTVPRLGNNRLPSNNFHFFPSIHLLINVE